MSEGNHKQEEKNDDVASKMGMWIFIFTELLLFGGLFLVYAVFRVKYADEFHRAAAQLNTFIGTLNTVILLVSSMTIAMSVTAIQNYNKKLAMNMILITLVLAFTFLVNKYFEWGLKIKHHLYPSSELMFNLKHGENIFFSLYYFMTGLHALHIIIGMTILTIAYVRVRNGSIHAGHFTLLENGGLYWHLVDLIWIFLFPLLYLIT
jgi:cytochrome c oxidase subunit 3